MDMFKNIIRRIWPLLFAAVIIAGGMTVPGTVAILADRTVPIVNTFCPDEIVYDEGEVEIQVLKTMRNLGKHSKLPEGFHFMLVNVETGEEYIATTAANGRASFRLSFDAGDVGTHIFRLTEVQGTAAGVTYSELVYEVRVDVTLADEMQITVYLDGERTELAQARFENLYDSSKDPETGDATPLLLYGLMLLAGSAGILLLIRKARNYAA